MSESSMSISKTLPRALPADGIAGLYADRVLDRGADPRAIASLSRHARLSGQRLPVMSAPFAVDVPLAETALQSRPRGSRRLIAAGIVALVLLPLGALVAGAETSTIADDFAANASREQGFGTELSMPNIDGIAQTGMVPNLGISVPGFGPASASGGSVRVDGRERRNQVDASVYTTEESDIVIDGESVNSNGRPPMLPPNVPTTFRMP